MRIVTINELMFKENDNTTSGYFGIVRECEYNGKNYAYKEFYEPSKILTPTNIFKFEQLLAIKKKDIKSPRYIVKKDSNNTGYLSEYVEGKSLFDLLKESEKIKIDNLRKTSKNIRDMLSYGIIHCDIRLSNIINGNLIDYDVACYKNIKPISDNLGLYWERYGITPELDIAMFNLATFQLMLGFEYPIDALKAIRDGEFGTFNTDE